MIAINFDEEKVIVSTGFDYSAKMIKWLEENVSVMYDSVECNMAVYENNDSSEIIRDHNFLTFAASSDWCVCFDLPKSCWVVLFTDQVDSRLITEFVLRFS